MPVKRSSYDSNSDTTSSKKPPKISLNDGASDDRELKPKGQGMEKKEQKPRIRTTWTNEEDAILLDLMQDLVKNRIWDSVKADGRLVHRDNKGIKVHAASLLNRIKGAK